MIDQTILYSECPCGSGKKLKFCCYPEIRKELPRDPSMADVTEAIRRRSQQKRMDEMGDGMQFIDLDRFHELIGRGLRSLHSGDYKDAKKKLLKAQKEFPMFPTAYNDLSLCALVQGDLVEAEKWANEVVGRFPLENPYGLALLADIKYLKGDSVGALDLIHRAEAIEPPSVDQATRLCESMGHFMDHERIVRYVDESGYADSPGLAFFKGIALANLGKVEDAEKSLRIARRGEMSEYAGRVLAKLERGEGPGTLRGNWMYFTPQSFTLYAGLLKGVRGGGAQQIDLSVDVVSEFVEVEANAGALDLMTAISILGTTASSRSERILSAIITSDEQTDSVRKAAKEAYAKRFGKGEFGERLRKANPCAIQQMIITESAATHGPLDPAFEESYFKAVKICLNPRSSKSKLEESLRLLEDLHAKIPDNPAVTNNYASVLSRLGRMEEAIKVVGECFAQHPDYVFGASNYLRNLILMNKMDEAKAVVEMYRLPQRIHPDAYMAWLKAESEYYIRVKDKERLKNVKDTITMLAENFKKN